MLSLPGALFAILAHLFSAEKIFSQLRSIGRTPLRRLSRTHFFNCTGGGASRKIFQTVSAVSSASNVLHWWSCRCSGRASYYGIHLKDWSGSNPPVQALDTLLSGIYGALSPLLCACRISLPPGIGIHLFAGCVPALQSKPLICKSFSYHLPLVEWTDVIKKRQPAITDCCPFLLLSSLVPLCIYLLYLVLSFVFFDDIIIPQNSVLWLRLF